MRKKVDSLFQVGGHKTSLDIRTKRRRITEKKLTDTTNKETITMNKNKVSY